MSDDWDLLARSAAGDGDAFRVIVERHQDRLVRLCQRLLVDREDALDAAQEVFIKAYQKAGDLQPRGELFTWLYRVATNHCFNRLRRRRIVRFLPFGDETTENASSIEAMSKSVGPETEMIAKERWQATQSAITRLPENQRAVLVLARFEGLSYRQIAEILEISESAVESRLFRAMRNLAKAQDSSPQGVTPAEAR
jgi:RNA polymerase sigma-70 factor (ECF subfamily)